MFIFMATGAICGCVHGSGGQLCTATGTRLVTGMSMALGAG